MNNSTMDKVINAMHVYQEREFDGIMAELNGNFNPYKNTPSSDKIWFIGLKL